MLPNFLTHYFRRVPFQTLSDLTVDDADQLVAALAEERTLPFRLTQAAYLPRRRQIEQQMREAFITKGGRPKRHHPQYFVLGRSTHWERLEPQSVMVPLAAFAAEVITFTYTDSYYTFSKTTLRGKSIPQAPYRQKVYRLEELEALVCEFGLPRGYTDPQEEFDVYIEAQVWDESPLRGSLIT